MLDKFPNLGQRDEEVNPRETERLLDWTLNYGTVEQLEALFDGGMDPDQRDPQGRTSLQILTSKGNKQGVEMCLARGADINAILMFQGRVPMTALDAALQTNQTEIVELLRSHGGKRGREINSESNS